jgi:4-amino-4-deoxy-L-arabinose transferase-like glycosyltransferase
MIEPRLFKKLSLAALAVLLFAQGFLLLNAPRTTDSWLLIAAAVTLYLLLFSQAPAMLPGRPPWRAGVTVRDRWQAGGTTRVLVGLSVAASLAAVIAFSPPEQGDWGWTLHLLSFTVLAAALLAAEVAQRTNPSLPTRGQSARSSLAAGGALALIVAAALVVRIWHSDSIPPGLWFDEAREGVVAREMAGNPAYRPFFIEYMDRPAQHALLAALLISTFGPTVQALRLAPALFGVLNILVAFLLFRRWLGIGGGLIAAALLAFMRYELTFSRIGFDANTVPFFMMLTLYFLDRGWERRQPSDYVFAGLVLGAGLSFYVPMRLFALLVMSLGIALIVSAVWRSRSPAPLKVWVPLAGWALLGLLVASAPLIVFVLRSPDIYFSRNESVSILSAHREPNVILAIWNSARSHLGMFNIQGDPNGRHNLPGAPMLDPVSGALLLTGLGLALRHLREGRNALIMLVSAGMLQAGILSTEWDAPQAVRSIGVIPGLVYLMTLALVVLQGDAARLLRWLWERRPGTATREPARWLPGLVPVVLLAVIAALNLDVYFNRQAVNREVWLLHSPEDTWMAQEMNRLGGTHNIILAADLLDSPTIQYLAPAIKPVRLWTGNDHLPLAGNYLQTVLLLNAPLEPIVAEARHFYPAAVIRELVPPGGGRPVAYEIILDR